MRRGGLSGARLPLQRSAVSPAGGHLSYRLAAILACLLRALPTV